MTLTAARVYWNFRSEDTARGLLEETLRIRREVLGPEHPEVAAILRNLGTLLGVMGDYPAAQRHIEEALAIDEKVWGPDHATTGGTLSELALVTVNGLTERSMAICRTDGRASPSGIVPLRIISISRCLICIKIG